MNFKCTFHNYKLRWIRKLTLNKLKSRGNSGNSLAGRPPPVRNYSPYTTKAKRQRLSTPRSNPKQNKKSKLKRRNSSPTKSAHRKQSLTTQISPGNQAPPSTLSTSSPRGKMKMPSGWKLNSISKKWPKKYPQTGVWTGKL